MQAATQSVITSTGERKNLSHMMSQRLKPTFNRNPLKRWYRGLRFFLLDNWQRCWVIVLWFIVMAILFTYKYIQYRRSPVYPVMGDCVCMAKGAAETVKLNMALILLPVCRNTITWLRNKTRLGRVVPFDDNLNFHKVNKQTYSKTFSVLGISYNILMLTKLGYSGGDYSWSNDARRGTFSV